MPEVIQAFFMDLKRRVYVLNSEYHSSNIMAKNDNRTLIMAQGISIKRML